MAAQSQPIRSIAVPAEITDSVSKDGATGDSSYWRGEETMRFLANSYLSLEVFC
jgi:hypothetical protein